MTRWRGKFAIAFGALGLLACMDNPVGPGALTLVLVGRPGGADSVWTGTPGDPLTNGVQIRVVGEGGRAVAGATLTWEPIGQGAHTSNVTTHTDFNGRARGDWWLGTNAAEEQQLHVTVRASGEQAELVLRARAVPSVVSGLKVSADSVLRLGDTLAPHVDAIDPYGNVFPAPDVTVSVTDSTIGQGTGAVVVGGPKRGAAAVQVVSHGVGVAVPLHVTQYVAAIVPARDTLVFNSLGAEQAVSYVVRDDRGREVADTAAVLSVSDTSVVRLSGTVVRSVKTGTASLRLQLAATTAAVPLVVDQRIATLRLHVDTIRFDALFDTTTLNPIVLDSLGAAVLQPVLQVGVGNQQIAEVAGGSIIQAVTPGVTTVTLVDPVTGISTSAPVIVHQLVRAIDIAPVTFDALGDTSTAAVTPRDRLGYAVAGAGLDYSVSDTSIARVDASGEVHSVRPGTVTLSVRDQETGALTSTNVVVQQRIASVVVNRDSLRFDAIGDTAILTLVARDRLGSIVADGAARTTYVSTNPASVPASSGGALSAAANGTALVIAKSQDGPADTVPVVVMQVPDSLTVGLAGSGSAGILSLPLDSPIPLSCAAYDRNHFAISTSPAVSPSPAGRWSGGTCADVRIQRSGFDTLRISAGAVHASVPVILAVRPIVAPATAEALLVDSLPAGVAPWAPTIRRNSQGDLEVYFAGYAILPDGNQGPGDLYRLSSQDGVHFRYEGRVLAHDSVPCTLQESGIENISIVPRSDGPGWRMYYSSGSLECYGWQVFSAVSTDEKTWQKEDGIRLSNGGSPPPAGPNTPLWPAGEGMATELLPSGEWRMVVSTYEHVQPVENKFQITEWRSNNQLDWTYVGTLFSTRQLPGEGQRSVYSPTLQEFSPGLWRMLVTADDLDLPGGQSRVWSVVSADKVSWQLEGQVLSAPGENYFYSTLEGNRLITVCGNELTSRHLCTATVQMP